MSKSNETRAGGGAGRRAMAVRERVLTEYARSGFAAIPPDDRYGRLRWWGLHVQRCPAGATAAGSGTAGGSRRDGFFQLRIRASGGELSLPQLRVLAEVGGRYSRGPVQILEGNRIQLSWIRIQDVPAIWEHLEAVCLRTRQSRSVPQRMILVSPVAGMDAEEILDPTGTTNQLRTQRIADPGLTGVLRRFRTAISGLPWLDEYQERSDLAFVGAQHPQFGPGFEVRLGPEAGRDLHRSRRIGAWVSAADVGDVWLGTVRMLRDYRPMSGRRVDPPERPVAEWSPARFREVLEREYLGHVLPAVPGPRLGSGRPLAGVYAQRDGRFWVGVAPTTGTLDVQRLPLLAATLGRFGVGRLRLTGGQHLIVPDVRESTIAGLIRELSRIGLRATHRAGGQLVR